MAPGAAPVVESNTVIWFELDGAIEVFYRARKFVSFVKGVAPVIECFPIGWRFVKNEIVQF